MFDFRWNIRAKIAMGHLNDFGHYELWRTDELYKVFRKVFQGTNKMPSFFDNYEPVDTRPITSIYGRVGFDPKAYAISSKRYKSTPHQQDGIPPRQVNNQATRPNRKITDPLKLQSVIDQLLDHPVDMATGNASAIYQKTGIHTTCACLLQLTENICSIARTRAQLNARKHGDLMNRLRAGNPVQSVPLNVVNQITTQYPNITNPYDAVSMVQQFQRDHHHRDVHVPPIPELINNNNNNNNNNNDNDDNDNNNDINMHGDDGYDINDDIEEIANVNNVTNVNNVNNMNVNNVNVDTVINVNNVVARGSRHHAWVKRMSPDTKKEFNRHTNEKRKASRAVSAAAKKARLNP
jgi:hypothetical protein